MSLYHICFVDLVGIRVKPIADTYLISCKVTFFLSKMGLFPRKSFSNGCDMPFPCPNRAVYGTFPVAVPAASVPVLVCRAADAWESAVNLANSVALFAKTAALSQNSAAFFLCRVPAKSRRFPPVAVAEASAEGDSGGKNVGDGGVGERKIGDFIARIQKIGRYGAGLFRWRRPALECRCERLIASCAPSCRFRGV